MMLFVIMFMISSFLYSARYWPDIYNYINANITIRRIPTISELELTKIDVIEVEYTTEIFSDSHYSTTDDDYLDSSTVNGPDIEEFMKDEINFNKKVKRAIIIEQLKDYIELPPRPIFVDYIFLEEPIKEDINIKRNTAGDETPPKEIEEDRDILKTLVTGMVIEDDLPKTTVSEEPHVTKKYYTVQPTKSEKSKRCVDEDETTELDITTTTEMGTTEFIPEHSTTKEGYLVGDDPNLKVDEVTEETMVLTTKANENELVDDEHDSRLIRDSVDVSMLSTRGPDDVEMVTDKPWKLQMMVS